MPDDPANIDLTATQHLDQFQDLGADTPPIPAGADLDEIDDEALKAYLANRGFEMHRNRRRRSMTSQVNDVKDKKRLTIHLPTALHKDLLFAMAHFELTKTQIMEDSLLLWLDHHKFRRPGA